MYFPGSGHQTVCVGAPGCKRRNRRLPSCRQLLGTCSLSFLQSLTVGCHRSLKKKENAMREAWVIALSFILGAWHMVFLLRGSKCRTTTPNRNRKELRGPFISHHRTYVSRIRWFTVVNIMLTVHVLVSVMVNFWLY